jgi:hypothetical protein
MRKKKEEDRARVKTASPSPVLGALEQLFSDLESRFHPAW